MKTYFVKPSYSFLEARVRDLQSENDDLRADIEVLKVFMMRGLVGIKAMPHVDMRAARALLENLGITMGDAAL